jgi:hypothetical protein
MATEGGFWRKIIMALAANGIRDAFEGQSEAGFVA